MPDWTYHPFFKPVLFRMPAEAGRRITLKLLNIQGRTAAGRALFKLFGHVHLPDDVAVEAFGLRFPSPVGLGAGIDTHGTAAAVMQYLGFGFIELGPASAHATPRRAATEPRRLEDFHSIVASDAAAAPAASELSRVIRRAPVDIPIGIALKGDDLAAAIEGAADAAFITLPSSAHNELESLRAATEQPLLLRLSPEWSDAMLDDIVARALDAGIDGFVVADGQASDLLEQGKLFGPGVRTRALAMVARVRAQSTLPIIASGAIGSPDDARAFLDAGATLLSLYDGLVYAGPGLPGRIVHALTCGEAKARPAPDVAPSNVPAWTWLCVCFTGLVLVLSGLFALYLSATDHMLPPDVAFLGMTADELCKFYDCRIVRFMVHDRVSFGGSILSVGITYLWIGAAPLRDGRAWAWWALLLSGGIGFGSFLTYLGHQYLDVWHGVATLLLLPFFVAGLAMSFRGLRRPRGPSVLKNFAASAWRWSPAGMGRMALGFAAFGMVAGGLTIMGVGMTRVFVPQDLEYMQLTVQQLNEINPRLVALIAHDRAGFGGGLCSGGLALAACLAYGLRPGSPGLWLMLLLSGGVGFSTAIGIHFIVGYVDFFHLLPAYVGALAFLIAMKLLYAPLCRSDPGSQFPDF